MRTRTRRAGRSCSRSSTPAVTWCTSSGWTASPRHRAGRDPQGAERGRVPDPIEDVRERGRRRAPRARRAAGHGAVRGAVPIIVDGVTLGAIAVSGVTKEIDGEIAQAAADAVADILPGTKSPSQSKRDRQLRVARGPSCRCGRSRTASQSTSHSGNRAQRLLEDDPSPAGARATRRGTRARRIRTRGGARSGARRRGGRDRANYQAVAAGRGSDEHDRRALGHDLVVQDDVALGDAGQAIDGGS